MNSDKDITIIFLTANKVPKGWAAFHKEKLLEATGNTPIITISKEPLDWGINVIQKEPYGISNVYWQLLRGAKMAKTKYIAVVEDDTLYPKEHFEFRPPLDTFAYNRNKFGLFTWGVPTFYWYDRFKNSTLVAPRELTVEALEERFAKYPKGTPESAHFTGELGRNNIEKNLGVTLRKSMWFTTGVSIVNLDHEFGIDHLGRTHRKAMGMLRAYEIPYWGRAEDIVKKFR